MIERRAQCDKPVKTLMASNLFSAAPDWRRRFQSGSRRSTGIRSLKTTRCDNIYGVLHFHSGTQPLYTSLVAVMVGWYVDVFRAVRHGFPRRDYPYFFMVEYSKSRRAGTLGLRPITRCQVDNPLPPPPPMTHADCAVAECARLIPWLLHASTAPYPRICRSA